jgi:hypothetical protein
MPFAKIFKKAIFYYGEFLAPQPTPKLEDYTLSVVRDCLVNIGSSLPYQEAINSTRIIGTLQAVVTRE